MERFPNRGSRNTNPTRECKEIPAEEEEEETTEEKIHRRILERAQERWQAACDHRHGKDPFEERENRRKAEERKRRKAERETQRREMRKKKEERHRKRIAKLKEELERPSRIEEEAITCVEKGSDEETESNLRRKRRKVCESQEEGELTRSIQRIEEEEDSLVKVNDRREEDIDEEERKVVELRSV